jgi:hypothetical protein
MMEAVMLCNSVDKGFDIHSSTASFARHFQVFLPVQPSLDEIIPNLNDHYTRY